MKNLFQEEINIGNSIKKVEMSKIFRIKLREIGKKNMELYSVNPLIHYIIE